MSFISSLGRVGALLAALTAIALPAVAQAGSGQGVPPQSAIKNASATWAMKGYMLDARGRPVFGELPPLAAIQAASDGWAAKARLLDVDGRPFAIAPRPVAPVSDGGNLEWGAFVIGAAAMLGLVLLAGGLVVGLRAASRTRVPAHRTS